MAWKIVGTYYGSCSCKVGCPCTLGEVEADQGWCSGGLALDIKSGKADGVSLSGVKVAFDGDWPSGFLGGKGKARLYFDPKVSKKQKAALEAILSGKKGGTFAALAALITKMLPSKDAAIAIKKAKNETRVKVGTLGEMVVKPLKGATGEFTRILHGAAAFRDDIILAKGIGSSWSDPQMRKWKSAGHAEQADFNWKG